MLNIQMPKSDFVPPLVYCGDRQRYGTATDVEFIDDNLLVSVSISSKMMYYIALLPNGLHQIIDQKTVKHHPDTMDYKDGMLLTADYPQGEPHGHASIYEYEHGKFRFRKEIQLSNTKAHGATIVDRNNIIITSQSDHNRGLLFVDTSTNKITKFDNFEHYPKDTCLQDGKLFFPCSVTLPNVHEKVKVQHTILYVFDFKTLKKIDEFSFEGQVDSIAVDGEDGFITVQDGDALLHFKFRNNKLSFVRMIEGFTFPHGIDIHNGRVAVTNYGDNSIRIFDKSELIE